MFGIGLVAYTKLLYCIYSNSLHFTLRRSNILMSANSQTTARMANQVVQNAGQDEAIVVDKFSKTYGSHRVVDNLHFTVHRGEVFALLGPNGAGKTTTVETLEGYRTPDEGSVRVLGLDPIREAHALKPHIGVMLQQDG